MKADLVIRGGTVVTAAGRTANDIAVRDGRIIGVLSPSTPLDADADDRRAGPPRPARRDRRPLAPSRAGLHPQGGHRHRHRACAAGGVTTSFAMPNVDPPPNTAERLDAMLELYARARDRRLERQRRGHGRRRRSRALADAWASPRSRSSWSSTPAASYPHMPGHRRPRPRRAPASIFEAVGDRPGCR